MNHIMTCMHVSPCVWGVGGFGSVRFCAVWFWFGSSGVLRSHHDDSRFTDKSDIYRVALQHVQSKIKALTWVDAGATELGGGKGVLTALPEWAVDPRRVGKVGSMIVCFHIVAYN